MQTMKELRLAAGLRQVDVAKKLDVDQGAVSKWESGETRPSRKYHKKLARLYGVAVDELVQSLVPGHQEKEKKCILDPGRKPILLVGHRDAGISG